MADGPPSDAPRHNHRGRADNCSIDCPAHPEWGRGVEPPSESMNVWCEGCGEEAVLDPAEVDGRVMMLCDRCYREVSEDE